MPLSSQQVPMPSQLWPGGQPFMQVTGCPQLLVAVPAQSPLHAVPSSKQHAFGPASPAAQTPPSAAHMSLHATDAPQLFWASPHEAPASSHAADTSSGLQQLPPLQIPAPGHVPQETLCPQF